MGEPAFLSEEFSNLVDPDLELVTTSGFGKNGAISVLQVPVSFIEYTIYFSHTHGNIKQHDNN